MEQLYVYEEVRQRKKANNSCQKAHSSYESYEADMKNLYKWRFGDSPTCSKEISACHINATNKVYLPGWRFRQEIKSFHTKGRYYIQNMLFWTGPCGLTENGTRAWIKINHSLPYCHHETKFKATIFMLVIFLRLDNNFTINLYM